MHGGGTYTWPNGSTYSGSWANDEHNGEYQLDTSDVIIRHHDDADFGGKRLRKIHLRPRVIRR